MATGNRVLKVAGGQRTVYFRSALDGQVLEEWMDGVWKKYYVHLNGELLSSVFPNDRTGWAHLFFNDHLGTPRMEVYPGGSVFTRRDYYPFGGEQTTPSGHQTHKFTGV